MFIYAIVPDNDTVFLNPFFITLLLPALPAISTARAAFAISVKLPGVQLRAYRRRWWRHLIYAVQQPCFYSH